MAVIVIGWFHMKWPIIERANDICVIIYAGPKFTYATISLKQPFYFFPVSQAYVSLH